MKRVLSLVLALVMVLGMIPTFAAEMTGGEHLLEHGFITGKPGDDVATKLDAGAALTRQELAALIAELMGQKDEAAVFAQPADYADADKIGAWAVPFVAYAQVNGWMSGKPGNLFDPTGPVPGQQLAAVLMNALGYTVDTQAKYATVIADAAGLGLAVPSGNLTRGQAFTAMWTAVSEVKVNGEEVTLGVKLGKLTPPAPVVTELMVSSMATTNYKEVVITFNQAVDATEAAKEANYAITGNTVAEATVDGAVVILTLGTEIAPQGSIEVTVKKALGLKEDYKFKVENVIDAVPPSVAGVTVFGNKQLKITFSEPIKEGFNLLSSYKINGNFFSASAPTISADRKVVTLNVTNRLPAGEHKLVVTNALKDYAGFSLIPNETAFVVATDTTAPTVVSVSATQTKLTVVFNEEIETPALADIVATVGTPTGTPKVEGATLTVDFLLSNPLPISSQEITLKNITDMYGNKAADLKVNVAATPDLVRPEFVSATAETQTKIVVEFSKDVVVNAANFVLKDKDNATVAGITAAYVQVNGVDVKTKIELTKGGGFASGTYTLTVKDVIDINPLQNKVLDTVVTVVVPDKTAPTATVNRDAGNNKIYVVFSEQVDAALATTKANYNYITVATIYALNAETTVKLLADNKTVELAFPATGDLAVNVMDVDVLQISGVKDLAGNVITTVAIPEASYGALAAAPSIASAEVTGKNTIVLTMAGEKIVDATKTVSDFVIKNADGDIITPINIAFNTTTNKITLTVNENISSNALYDGAAVKVWTLATTNAKDVYGRALTAIAEGAALTASDKFAPTVTMGDLADTDTDIILTFSEAMEANNVTLNGLDLAAGGQDAQFIVLVNGAVVAQVSNDGTSATEITIVVAALAKDDVVEVRYFASPTTALNIRDIADNNVANFTLTKTVQ